MKAIAPVCSVIMPVYNLWDLTRASLVSLRDHSAGHDLEVIVADNASTDATATELMPLGKSLFGDRFSVITFPENKNFGPACNITARAAAAPLLFFLNNDTLLTPGWLPPLLDAMREDNAPGAVGPLLLYADGTVQHMGVAFNAIGPLHIYQGFPADHPVVAKKRALQGLTGAALMIRADVFRECGEFFPEYRNGYEDMELSVRIREKGKQLRCITESRVYHLESRTPGRKNNEEDNSRTFTRRCGDSIYIDLHHHALRDGFAVYITDILSLGIRMTEEDEQALIATVTGLGGDAWLRQIKANPLWVRGREIVAHNLEQAGKLAEALVVRTELAEIEMLIPRYQQMLRLSDHVDEAGGLRLEYIHKRLDAMLLLKDDAALARKKVRQAAKRFKRGGDAFLEAAYAAKLREMFPELSV